MFFRAISYAALLGLFGLALSAHLYASSPGAYEESKKIGDQVSSFKELSDRFAELANEKGAVYAFEVLKRAELPPNTDLHLLGHVVGDELYEQKGIDAIADCTQDFRNACSHAIVIGTLGEYGNAALDRIRGACHRAPGGSGAYTMCFHGLGHGVLAFNEYDFTRTQEFCEKTGTDEYQHQEYSECMGGAVMEIIGGGGHDQKTWGAQRRIYLSENNPLSLCQEAFFGDEGARTFCYMYITPFLFEAAGADLGRPLPHDFERAFEFCAELPEASSDRATCFGGFGKEFLVLAQDRDVRAIESMNENQMRLVHTWCELAHDETGTRECMFSAVQSAYWGGENDPRAAILLCAVAPENYRATCFEELFGAVETYVADTEYRTSLCADVPEAYEHTCTTTLL